MNHLKVANRYAKSLLSLAIEQKCLDSTKTDMELIVNTCSQNHDFILLLRSPIVKPDKKKAILLSIFGDKVSKLSLAFITIITTKRRENILPEIANEFVKQYKFNKNIVTAEVTTAITIDEKLKNKVLKIIEGDEIEIIDKVNKELIGGLIVRIGDRQVDGSIIKQLNRLKSRFDDNPFIKDY